DVRVEAIREYLARAPGHLVESACEAHREPLDCPGERGRLVSLDDQMQVSALDGVVHHPHPESPLRRPKRALDGALAGEPAQEARCSKHPHRDVHRMPRLELRPALVRDARLLTFWLAASSIPFPAPGGELHLELLRHGFD